MSDSRQTRISIPGDDEGGRVGCEDQNGGASTDSLSNNSGCYNIIKIVYINLLMIRFVF